MYAHTQKTVNFSKLRNSSLTRVHWPLLALNVSRRLWLKEHSFSYHLQRNVSECSSAPCAASFPQNKSTEPARKSFRWDIQWQTLERPWVLVSIYPSWNSGEIDLAKNCFKRNEWNRGQLTLSGESTWVPPDGFFERKKSRGKKDWGNKAWPRGCFLTQLFARQEVRLSDTRENAWPHSHMYAETQPGFKPRPFPSKSKES